MQKTKKLLRPFYVKPLLYLRKKMRGVTLVRSYIRDYRLYRRYSIVFSQTDIKNKEAYIILQYHSLEKGMLYPDMKPGFAKNRIQNLHKSLKDPDVIKHVNDRNQIKVAYQVICKYYELHQDLGYNIEHLYNIRDYKFYKSVLDVQYDSCFNGSLSWTKDDFFKANNLNFSEFAHSRKSTREFTGERVSLTTIQNVIKLSNTAPSVCNRQASSVYLIEDKIKIDQILKIQGGFKGYSQNVNQLLILTNDRKYYYTVGERNQFYIDGGIYLMNLLYALHFYKVGNCPANWAKTHKHESMMSEIISIPYSEQIICVIPIGQLPDNFKTTLSKRREFSENLIVL